MLHRAASFFPKYERSEYGVLTWFFCFADFRLLCPRARVPVEFRLFWRDTLCPFAAVLDVSRKSKAFGPHLYPGNKTESFSHLFYSIRFWENACRSRKTTTFVSKFLDFFWKRQSILFYRIFRARPSKTP